MYKGRRQFIGDAAMCILKPGADRAATLSLEGMTFHGLLLCCTVLPA